MTLADETPQRIDLAQCRQATIFYDLPMD